MNSSNYLRQHSGVSSRHGMRWRIAAMQGSRASLSHHKIIFPDTRVVYSNAPAMSGGEQEADAFGRLSLRPQWRRAGAGSTWHACQRKAAPAAPAGDRPGASAAAAATAGSAAAPAQPAAPTIDLASAAAPTVPEPAVSQEKQAAAAPLEEWEVLWSGEGDEPAIPLPFGMPHPAPEAAQQLAAIAPAGLQSQLQQRQQQQLQLG